jgi:hypothetical protein
MALGITRPAVAVLLAVVGLALPGPASATPGPAAAATTCLGGAVTVSTGDAIEFGPYTASPRCNDINVRIVGGDSDTVNACVRFTRYGTCNYWTTVGWGWRTIATDVLDGSSFTVPLGVPLEGATAKVQIAF